MSNFCSQDKLTVTPGTTDTLMKKAQDFGTIAGGNESKVTIRDKVKGYDPVQNLLEYEALHDFASIRNRSNVPITADEIFEFTVLPYS